MTKSSRKHGAQQFGLCLFMLVQLEDTANELQDSPLSKRQNPQNQSTSTKGISSQKLSFDGIFGFYLVEGLLSSDQG